MNLLAKNTILITGGGSGIGRGLAEAFHKLGNHVIIAGRRRNVLDEVTAANPGMTSHVLDVSDPAKLNAFAADVVAKHPALNVLINMAGVSKPENLVEGADPSIVDDTIATNLVAPLQLTAALLPHLKQQSNAVIMNVTSGLAFIPLAMNPTYCATKAAQAEADARHVAEEKAAEARRAKTKLAEVEAAARRSAEAKAEDERRQQAAVAEAHRVEARAAEMKRQALANAEAKLAAAKASQAKAQDMLKQAEQQAAAARAAVVPAEMKATVSEPARMEPVAKAAEPVKSPPDVDAKRANEPAAAPAVDDAKASDPAKAMDAKAAGTEPADAVPKAPDAKAADAKASEGKAPDVKPADTKASEAEGADEPATTASHGETHDVDPTPTGSTAAPLPPSAPTPSDAAATSQDKP